MATQLDEQDEGYRQIGFHPEGDFPNKSLKMDEIVNFVICDGGEIRVSAAFEPDGMTVKEGWKRLYWK